MKINNLQILCFYIICVSFFIFQNFCKKAKYKNKASSKLSVTSLSHNTLSSLKLKNKNFKHKKVVKNKASIRFNKKIRNRNRNQTIKQINPDINVVGNYKPGFKNTLDKFPYEITSCDQTAFITAKKLIDLNDFSKQKEAYFSINAYYIFEFDSKDVNTLRNSELVHEMKHEPSILMGAPGCVKTDKLHICLDNKENALNIIDVINKFKFCKLGVGLDQAQILRVVRACKQHHSGLSEELKNQGIKSNKSKSKYTDENKVNWSAWTDIVPGA